MVIKKSLGVHNQIETNIIIQGAHEGMHTSHVTDVRIGLELESSTKL